MCGGGDSSAAIQQQQLQRQQAIQQGMGKIDQAFAGYGPGFYEGVRKNTLGTLMPQLQRQYQDTKRGAVFGLGNKGLLDSSAARSTGTALERDRGLGQILVANQANQAAQDTQKQVEGQKQSLTNQLVVSQDPTVAAQQAVGAAASIAAPSVTAPLGNLFQTFANTYLARGYGSLYGNQQPLANSFAPGNDATGKNYYIK